MRDVTNTGMERIIAIGGRKEVYSSEILFLQADQNYTYVYLQSGEYEYVATTMGIIEKRLTGCGFVRPNRKTVVNVRFIQRANATCIWLKNDRVIKISRRRKIFL